jgi:nitrogen fixation/metabolism regulation signal transduction histidine kinase
MAQQLAHEIKNPLTPIKLSAERVLRRWRNNPEKTGEIIENSMLAIIQEVESLSNLLSEFRTLSRPIEATSATCDIRETILEEVAPFAQSNSEVSITTDGLPQGVYVKMERKHIGQIVMNLVSNAIDAMDGKGTIDIRAASVTKRDAPFCRLSFTDNGKGIPPEAQKAIFTPYFTTKSTGTGLGLAIVERIVSDSGGSVSFNTSPDVGTTFFVDLPVGESHKPLIEGVL